MASALVFPACPCSPRLPGLVGHRRPDLALSGCEADPARLSEALDLWLSASEPDKGEVQALVVPHAGYSHSGELIAKGLGAVRGRTYRRIVEISATPSVSFDGAALPAQVVFDTPLGPLRVDEAAVGLLAQYPHFARRDVASDGEHALEGFHAFLQHLWPQAKLVPLLVGNADGSALEAIARALRNVLDEETLLVATTALTHFPPELAAGPEANRSAEGRSTSGSMVRGPFPLDGGPEAIRARLGDYEGRFISALLARSPTALEAAYRDRAMPLCDPSALQVLLRAIGPGAKGCVLARASSFDVEEGPDNLSRASYLTALFPGRLPAIPALDPDDRRVLGAIAEDAVAAAVYGREERPLPPLSPRLRQKGGAFVTVQKRGHLKGCMGRLEAESIALAVQVAGRMAVSSDPRFAAVRAEELAEVEIEISVLGPFQEIDSPEAFEPGRHGLLLARGPSRGLLLPQVATRYGMGRRAFLEALAEKAGLDEDETEGATLQRFGVEAFEP